MLALITRSRILGPRLPIVAVAAVLVAVCHVTTGAAGGAAVHGGVVQDGELHPFSHDRHVSEHWLKPSPGARESGADCRGCHTFDSLSSATDGSEGPGFLDAEQCQSCHIPGVFEVRYAGVENGSVREARNELAESFRHAEHLNLECAECHRETAENGVTGRMVVPTGIDSGYCSSCHSGAFEWQARLRTGDQQADYRRSRSADEMLAAFSTGLADRWRVLAVDFSHASHVAGFASGDFSREACVQCHTGIASRVKADIVPERFDAGSCSECHAGMEAGVTQLEPAPSLTAGSFLHGRHSSLACGECHAPGVKGSGANGTPELSTVVLKSAAGGDVYGSCVDCHAKIESTEHSAPLRVEGHGDLELQGDCSACHVVGSSEATTAQMFRSLRPVAVHERTPLQHFLNDFSHSEVEALDTRAGCSDCHRAPMEGARAERAPVAFVHGDHIALGEGIDEGTCVRCHTGMDAGTAAVTRTADIAPGHRGVEGEAACAACHKSAYESGDPALPREGVDVERLVFSHSAHRSSGCLDCHSPSDESPNGMVTDASARACTDCHSHASELLVPGQKGMDLATVQDCAQCHALGVPAHGEAVLFQRQTISTLTGTFVHPALTGNDCSECHRVNPRSAPTITAPVAGSAGQGSGAASTALARWPGGLRSEDLKFAGRYRSTSDGQGSPHLDRYRDQRIATEERLGAQSSDGNRSGEKYFSSHITYTDPDSEPAGTRCLPCHWNCVSSPDSLGYTNLYDLVTEAQIRKKFAPGLLDTWLIGLPGVRRPEKLFPR